MSKLPLPLITFIEVGCVWETYNASGFAVVTAFWLIAILNVPSPLSTWNIALSANTCDELKNGMCVGVPWKLANEPLNDPVSEPKNDPEKDPEKDPVKAPVAIYIYSHVRGLEPILAWST